MTHFTKQNFDAVTEQMTGLVLHVWCGVVGTGEEAPEFIPLRHRTEGCGYFSFDVNGVVFNLSFSTNEVQVRARRRGGRASVEHRVNGTFDSALVEYLSFLVKNVDRFLQ